VELKEGSAAIGIEMEELQKATTLLKEAAEGISGGMRDIGKAVAGVSELSRRNQVAIEAVDGLIARYVLD
jgi:hypothetical protein